MPLNKLFALIGLTFGAVFVFVNAGALPHPWPVIARVVGGVLVVGAIWFGLVKQPAHLITASRAQARTYWAAVVAEVIAIPVGALVLNRLLHRPHLVVVWVVFVVGAHFLPARAFGGHDWFLLGLLLVGLAVVGGILTETVDHTWASATAVLAGAALLTFAALPHQTPGAATRPA